MRHSSCVAPASRARDCKPTCAARPGAGCAIWPTKVEGLDSRRHEHSGLRPPRKFTVSRPGRGANSRARRGIHSLVNSLALCSRVSRHRHPSPHLQPSDAFAARSRSGGRLARNRQHSCFWPSSTDHWPALRTILARGRIAGAQVHDARIAALCRQHGVRELWSADRDFNRFAGLAVVNPLVGRG